MTNDAQNGSWTPENGNGSMPELMTVKQFAELTHRTPSAVRAAIARGEIPADKLASCQYFILRSDILAMFEKVHARQR